MRQESSDPLEGQETARVRGEQRLTPVPSEEETGLTSSASSLGQPWHGDIPFEEAEKRIELREEQLVAQKELVDLGEIVIRTAVDEVPGRLEVDAIREEAEVEHVPVGQVVSERVDPWEEDGALVIPLYEEQLVVVKRLYLREQLRIRRVGTTARQVFQDTLRQERLVVEDPHGTGLVHEVFPRGEGVEGEDGDGESDARPGFLENVVRKAFE
jgi:uncharacterized protein (TIGR02271 family)